MKTTKEIIKEIDRRIKEKQVIVSQPGRINFSDEDIMESEIEELKSLRKFITQPKQKK